MFIYARFRPNKKQHLYENPLLLKEGHVCIHARFMPNKKDHLYENPIEGRACLYMPIFGQIKNSIYMKIPFIEGRHVFICPFSAK